MVSLASCARPRAKDTVEPDSSRGTKSLGHAGARSVMMEAACDAASGEPPLTEFRPRSMLKVAEHHLERAKFPVVDAHTHFRLKLDMTKDGLPADTKLENL
jgi:hypothetical protein